MIETKETCLGLSLKAGTTVINKEDTLPHTDEDGLISRPGH